ncbi:MAG TPA: hypothetical protein VGJ92_10615 [Methanocella sp.]
MTEPYTDLPAVGMVVIGILLFGYVLCSAYSAYESKAAYADLKDDLRTMAVALSGDPGIAVEGSATVLDAHKLANLSTDDDLSGKYGRPGEAVAIEVIAGVFRWSSNPVDRVAASYVLPVTVRLNDARCLAGTLILTVGEARR